jgi:polysaccharide export outer membrane protein
MTSKLKLSSLAVLILVLSSCSSFKKTQYFQNSKLNTSEAISNFNPVTVQKQDLLAINVSSLNPESSAIFNTNLTRLNGNNYDVNPINPVTGYLVDQDGNVQLPLIGALKVDGLTITQVQSKILSKVAHMLKEPTVTVRLMNFKITVLGDVGHPGVFQIPNERITFTEALGLAGDLNITALRKDVLLIREVDGQRQTVALDLTSDELLKSPFYYLKNNDVLYVQAGKNKYAQASRGFQTGTLVLSALSIVAIVFSTLHN